MKDSACVDQSALQMHVERTLAASEQQRVNTHLAECATCRLAVAEYKQLMWDLRQPVEIPIPAELERSYDRLLQAWKDEQRAQATARSRTRSIVPAWAGYSVRWTRNLPGVGSLGAMLSRGGNSAIRSSLTRLLGRKGRERRFR